MNTIAFVLIVLAAVMHASWTFAVKKVGGSMAVLSLAQLAAAVLVLPLAIQGWNPDEFVSSLPYVAATAVLQTLFFVVMSATYKLGEISIVYPLTRGTAVFSLALFGVLFSDENLSALGLVGIGAVVLGVLTLVQLTSIHSDLEARARHRKTVALALLLGLISALCALVDKWSIERCQPGYYIFAMMLLPSLYLVPATYASNRNEMRLALAHHKKAILTVGVGLSYGYLLVLYAMRLGPLSYIFAVREVSVVIGAILGVVFLKETLTRRKIYAMAAIVAGLVFLRLA